MLLLVMAINLNTLSLISQSSIVTALIVITIFFAILLLLGVRKSYKLKKENELLNAMDTEIPEDEDKPYQDFTDGHMYSEK